MNVRNKTEKKTTDIKSACDIYKEMMLNPPTKYQSTGHRYDDFAVSMLNGMPMIHLSCMDDVVIDHQKMFVAMTDCANERNDLHQTKFGPGR